MGGTAGALELGRSGMPDILAQPATNPSPFKQPSGPHGGNGSRPGQFGVLEEVSGLRSPGTSFCIAIDFRVRLDCGVDGNCVSWAIARPYFGTAVLGVGG